MRLGMTETTEKMEKNIMTTDKCNMIEHADPNTGTKAAQPNDEVHINLGQRRCLHISPCFQMLILNDDSGEQPRVRWKPTTTPSIMVVTAAP
jgi:hypothetical protein